METSRGKCRWKGWYNMRTKAQGERSNNSKKWKVDATALISSDNCLSCKISAHSDKDPSEAISVKGKGHENSLRSPADENFPVTVESESRCSCFVADSDGMSKDSVGANSGPKLLSDGHSDDDEVLNGSSFSKSSTCILKSKSNSENDLYNPKPTKSQRPTNDPSYLSCRYSERSFCGIADYLPDGFYDAGRDRPFMALGNYEQNLHANLREVVLLDRGRDEELDIILLCARAFLSRFKQMSNSINGHTESAIDSLQLALLLFVSDHLGGSDKSADFQRTRRAVIGSRHTKPFVCTCPTGIIGHRDKVCKVGVGIVEDVVFHDICEKSLKSTKERLNSIIVPIGVMQYGVCRHRAFLMKYLCDRMEP